MAYNKQTWADGAAGNTPLSAARMSHIEDGISQLDSEITAIPASPPNRAAGLNAFHYGDSLSIDPPVAGVTGKAWMNLSQKILDLDRWYTYAIGGSDAIGVAFHVVNGSTGGLGLPAAAPGAKWDGSRRGYITLTLGINDASATKDRYTNGIINPSPIDAATISGLTGALRAILAIFSSASRVEVETATLTGTWITNSNTQFSGGVAKYTQTAGDHADFANVLFPASGRVHLIAHSLDPLNFNPAAIEISIDGVVTKTVDPSVVTMRPQKTSATATIIYAPCAIEIDATPGTHTITVTNRGTGTNPMMSLDCIVIPAASPPPAFHIKEYIPSDTLWGSNAPMMHDNIAQLFPAYDAVVAEFPNASQILIDSLDPSSLSTVDNLHPNERGHNQIAAIVSDGVLQRLATFAPDNLFYSLGAVVSPQISQFNASGVWPAASAADVKIYTKAMICVYGGTVTAISIDGTPTGLTSGAFIVRAGHRISVTYTAAPSFTNWDAA